MARNCRIPMMRVPNDPKALGKFPYGNGRNDQLKFGLALKSFRGVGRLDRGLR